MKIRTASVDDIALIKAFIQQKANFDRQVGAFSGELKITEEKIQKTLFGQYPFSFVVFATEAEIEVGFALYAFRYSSFIGQSSIWLDDLYIKEENRGYGYGRFLMESLQQKARVNDCTHLAWTADDRNLRGLSFYRNLGAKIIEKKGHQCFFRLESPINESTRDD